MEQFHLIIQKTTTGLSVDYSSPGIDPEHPNVSATLEDERDITQIVKESDVYSLKITNHYRIYSLIVKDSDNFGRPGFYEFKLYGPRNYALPNFVDILQAIKLLYNDNANNKPYEDLLSTILITPHISKDNHILVKPNNKKFYSFYDENDSNSLKETFNDKGVYIISKLYALNRLKAYGEPVIKEVGLLPFSKGHFREVVISNPHGVLNQLFLNNEKLPVNTFKEEFKILVEPIDLVTYSTSDSKSIKTIVGPIGRIERKPPIYKPAPPIFAPVKRKSFLRENGIYLLALVIMMGGLGLGFPYYKDMLGFKSPVIDDSTGTPEKTEQNNEFDDKQITFYTTIEGDEFSYKTSYNCLDNYLFKYSPKEKEGSKWSYINFGGKGEYNDFNRDIVKDLKVENKVILNEDEQLRFIAALEKVSGKTISTIKKNEENPASIDLSTRNGDKTIKNKDNQIPVPETKKETGKSILNPITGELTKSDN